MTERDLVTLKDYVERLLVEHRRCDDVKWDGHRKEHELLALALTESAKRQMWSIGTVIAVLTAGMSALVAWVTR